MPRRAICSKIRANKMPSGFSRKGIGTMCGSNFIVPETYRRARYWDFKSNTLNAGLCSRNCRNRTALKFTMKKDKPGILRKLD